MAMRISVIVLLALGTVVEASRGYGLRSSGPDPLHTVARKQRRLHQVNTTEVIAWGSTAEGEQPLPAEVLIPGNIVAVSAGGFHSLALTKTGKVIAWGLNGDQQSNVINDALSNIAAISGGSFHSVALTNDGRVVLWGDNTQNQTNLPAEVLAARITAIAAGGAHTLALSSTGRVYAWGMNTYGPGGPISNQVDVPTEALSNIVAIDAGGYHSIALTNTGRVIAWGGNEANQTVVPPEALSNVVAISAGGEHNMAILAPPNGTRQLVIWGRNLEKQVSPVPAEATVDIADIVASYFVSVVRTTSGRVIVWGDDQVQTQVPAAAQQGVRSVSAWGSHLIAIDGPVIASPPPAPPLIVPSPPSTSLSPPVRTADESSSPSPNVPLIVGLTVGLGGAALLAIVAALIIFKRRSKSGDRLAAAMAKDQPPPDVAEPDVVLKPDGLTALDSSAVITPSENSGVQQPASLVGSTAAVEINVRAIFLQLAQETCDAKPQNNEVITAGTPLVDGLALDVDVTKDVVVTQVIGEGGCGVVHKGVYKGSTAAIKIIPATDSMYIQELGILGRLRHPNIVSLLGAGVKGKQVYLIMELADTSLDKLLYAKSLPIPLTPAPAEVLAGDLRGRLLPLPTVLSIAVQLARGLVYLHPTVIHRDLKPANILINKPTENGSSMPLVKLSDFGLARMMASVVLQTGRPAAGTFAYMAPECFNKEQEGLTCKADIYSFGMCLWEMLHGEEPWHNQDPGLLLFAVVIQSKRPNFTVPHDRCPTELRHLIKQCWEADARLRPSASDLVVRLSSMLQGLQAP